MEEKQIVIAGGGVSGLFCAIRLAQAGRQVLILEASADRWGGRIETEKMDGFIAEYGPMRFEPTLQPRFAALCADLDVGLVDFCGPSAEEIPAPDSELPIEEQGLNSLQLLKRGIMLIMGQDPHDQAWLDSLTELDYAHFRQHALLHNQPLWATGFWNALSARGILSHRALVKLRDTGTFYHMIPENLNAIEWIIWWLRALKTVGLELASIDGGTSRLVERLLSKIQSLPTITLAGGHTLLNFRPAGDNQSSIELQVATQVSTISLKAAHLILALPRMPLKKIAPSLPSPIAQFLDSVNGFPMLKIFLVSNSPWWDYEQPPQQYANCMPTREIHYFRRPKENDHDGHGMVLLYMDRPATEFWRHYLRNPDQHDRAELGQDERIVDAFALFIARDVKRRLETHEKQLKLNSQSIMLFRDKTLEEATAYIKNSIIAFGIRDWSRAPFGAANHGWQPGVKSWEVMNTFKGFDIGCGAKNIHIVGEAYSDYQGFVEGALNTSELALKEIIGST